MRLDEQGCAGMSLARLFQHETERVGVGQSVRNFRIAFPLIDDENAGSVAWCGKLIGRGVGGVVVLAEPPFKHGPYGPFCLGHKERTFPAGGIEQIFQT